MPTLAPTPALDAYEQLAPYYDQFTSGYDYDAWLARLEALARHHGLAGRRLLDVACGSGHSLAPLLRRGYEVQACDLSPRMVALARGKFPEIADHIVVADMRRLPRLGRFDLVTCLGDSVNYLLGVAELQGFFESVAANLAAGGLLAFDLNTLRTYRTSFATEARVQTPDLELVWRGEGSSDAEAGSVSTAVIEATGSATRSLHVQRHHPPADVRSALAAAGMQLVASYGQRPGAVLEPGFDEADHHKVLHFATLDRCTRQGGLR